MSKSAFGIEHEIGKGLVGSAGKLADSAVKLVGTGAKVADNGSLGRIRAAAGGLKTADKVKAGAAGAGLIGIPLLGNGHRNNGATP